MSTSSGRAQLALALVITTVLSACGTRDAAPAATRMVLAPGTPGVAVGPEPHVFEISDGRAAITAMGLHAVIVLDFATGRADTIGRDGAGPGEFARPALLTSWGNEHFAVVDPVLRRATVLSTGGKPDTLMAYPPAVASQEALPFTDGTWLSLGVAPKNDSLPLIRVYNGTNKSDTLAWLAFPPRHFVPLGAIALNMPLEYSAADVWGQSSDGRVWIARAADNHVDWISRDGTTARSQPFPYERIKTVPADQRKHQGLPATPFLDTVEREMAAEKAPFQDVVAGPDGELWFWLNQPAGYLTERYMLLKRDGKSHIEVELPGGHKVLAVSKRFVYSLGADADGEMIISRHDYGFTTRYIHESPR